MKIRDMSVTDLLKQGKRVSHNSKSQPDVKLALLGSMSMQFIALGLKAGFDIRNRSVEILEPGFDSIKTSILNRASSVYQFKPDVCIIIPDSRDLVMVPQVAMSQDHIDALVDDEIEKWRQLWETLQTHLPKVQILQSNYVVDYRRKHGQIDTSLTSSLKGYLDKINAKLVHNTHNVHILDFEYVASYYGKKQWFDRSQAYLSKLPFSLECLPLVIEEIVLKYESLVSSPNKVLILDLDHTLWGGVIGDVGVSGLELGPSSPLGEAYHDFQKHIVSLYQQGVLLAVCSKNDLDVAQSGFDHPNMIIKREMISTFEANWEPKSDNILRITQALNLGLDACVFVDDNPFEQQQVKTFLPQVTVLEMGEDPFEYVDILDQSLAFNWPSITQEDLVRNASYRARQDSEALKTSFESYDAYLESLEMCMHYRVNDRGTIKRFTQLINKSNQFNVCTKRVTEAQIHQYMQSDTWACLAFSLSDAFVDYGIIACVVLEMQDGVARIDNLVMSCRVLSRGVELEVMNTLKHYAKRKGCVSVEGSYIPSDRNKMVCDLFPRLGFEPYQGRYRTELMDIEAYESKIRMEHES